MRGKPNDETSISAHTGITPAGAGKTLPVVAVGVLIRDHPRRCGENRFLTVLQFRHAGSPPQVRGKRFQAEKQPQGSRITPAGAGKTISEFHLLSFLQDHPRRCGENFECRLSGVYLSRITPAGAGKTLFVPDGQEIAEDHPRRCGENRERKPEKDARKASPPQVRGKPLNSSFKASRDGITPAGAGKTLGDRVNAVVAVGSPPQVRGKLHSSLTSSKRQRITPAGAGKTLNPWRKLP